MYAYNSGLNYYETQPNPAMGDRSFKKAEEMFNETLDRCSDFHANCSYYLGVINYTQQDMEEATKSGSKCFKEYKHSETERYPDDFTKKLADVNEVLGDLEQDQAIKENKVPFEPQLVRNVSSNKNEYFPMISPDNELMFYTRKLDRRDPGAIKSNWVEEFTVSHRKGVKSPFDGGSPLANPFNDGSFRSYGAATLSVDNKEMIICACNPVEISGQSYMNCDLYRTTYERKGTGGNDYEWDAIGKYGRQNQR